MKLFNYKLFHFPKSKEDFWDKYITVRKYLDKGHAEFYWLKGLATMVLIPSAWLKVYFPQISIYFTIIFAVVGFVVWFSIGFFWDKYKIYQREAEWSNKRNSTLQEIKNNTKKEKFK